MESPGFPVPHVVARQLESFSIGLRMPDYIYIGHSQLLIDANFAKIRILQDKSYESDIILGCPNSLHS
jgi:hypothetical protein